MGLGGLLLGVVARLPRSSEMKAVLGAGVDVRHGSMRAARERSDHRISKNVKRRAKVKMGFFWAGGMYSYRTVVCRSL